MAAAKKFGLDWEELQDRHDLASRAFETGKITLNTYLERIVFYRYEASQGQYLRDQRRKPVPPGLFDFQLRRQPEQRRLIAKRRGELHAHRQP